MSKLVLRSCKEKTSNTTCRPIPSSIGRNSKKSTVDVDLSSLGGGMNISRHHARIFYDFTRRRFGLEVLGKNGRLVEDVLHLPGTPPVKLDSQDLLQIGDKEFYLLLPVRSILGGALEPRHHVAPPPPVSARHYNYQLGESSITLTGKKGRDREYLIDDNDDDEEEEEENGACSSSSGGLKKIRREGYRYGDAGAGSGHKQGLSGSLNKKAGRSSRIDRDADNQQLMQLEEKDVVSSVATVLSDIRGPGDWMPMEKLHAELLEQFSSIWHHSRVRRYLTSDDCHGPESKSKLWYGLLMLLRKYPEHFVINT